MKFQSVLFAMLGSIAVSAKITRTQTQTQIADLHNTAVSIANGNAEINGGSGSANGSAFSQAIIVDPITQVIS